MKLVFKELCGERDDLEPGRAVKRSAEQHQGAPYPTLFLALLDPS